MKIKQKLAIEAVKSQDFLFDENRRAYGHGYLEAFDKVKETISQQLSDAADWACEGFNSGDKTIQECAQEEALLRYWSRRVKKLGEEEVKEEDDKSRWGERVIPPGS